MEVQKAWDRLLLSSQVLFYSQLFSCYLQMTFTIMKPTVTVHNHLPYGKPVGSQSPLCSSAASKQCSPPLLAICATLACAAGPSSHSLFDSLCCSSVQVAPCPMRMHF